MTKFTTVSMTLAVGLALAALPRAQNQTAPPSQPTFRSSVQYIEVDARVLDSKNNPIRDLKKEDFKLFEDGVEQTLDTFTAVDIPIETVETAVAAARTPAPDVVTNTEHNTLQGRIYVLLLDDRLIDASRTQQTIAIARQFVERNLGPHDLAAVITSSGRADMGQNFTSNKQTLISAIGKFIGRKAESLAIQRANTPILNEPGIVSDPLLRAEHFEESRLGLLAVETTCNWLASLKGMTKSLILISEGIDYDYESDPIQDPYAASILAAQRDMMAAATRANVTIYPVDPRGLGQDDSITVSVVNRGDDAGGASIATQLRQEMDRAHSSLREIAANTGGIEALGTNKMDVALDRIVRQSSTYYLLGYHPKNQRREGRFRTIKLTVSRPGATVVSRRGYGEPSAKPSSAPSGGTMFAGPRGASPEINEALNSPLPMNELTLSTTAVAFRGNDSRASVAVVVECPSLTFVPKDGKLVGTLEIITAAVDDRSEIAAGSNGTLGFGLTPMTALRVQELGFRTLTQLTGLKPGRYELRIALVDKETSRRGSVWYTFDVPDFSRGKLAMSGLLLSSLAESRTPTGNPDKILGEVTKLPPTTVRQFRASDELTVSAEIYDNELAAEHQVDLTTTVTSAEGKEIFNSSDWASFEELTSAKGTYRLSTFVTLSDAAPGNYTIKVTAQRKVDNPDPPVVRSIPIKIVR